jgi:hypothetical protein
MVPLILPCATLYFFISWFTAKYNFIFVFHAHHEGLNMTEMVIDRSVVAIFIYQVCLSSIPIIEICHQLTMLGVLSLKLFAYGVNLVFAVVATGIVRWYTGYRYISLCSFT